MADSRRDADYQGSRKKKMRYEYSGDTWAAFIEWTPRASHGLPSEVIESFRQSLTAVPGVMKVELHPKGSKHDQGNPGNHYQDHNFAVYSNKLPNTYMEFELTRNQHMENRPFTVSAMYKNPTWNLIPEAWRILRAACQGKELLPDLVADTENKILTRWASQDESGSANSSVLQINPRAETASSSMAAPMVVTAQPVPVVAVTLQLAQGLVWREGGKVDFTPAGQVRGESGLVYLTPPAIEDGGDSVEVGHQMTAQSGSANSATRQ